MGFQNEKLLDQIGLKILSVLQKDARVPLSRIGKKVGLSAPAVAERMRKLEETGIIKGYHARIAPEAVGRSVSAFIKLTTDPQNYKAVKAMAVDMKQIIACHHNKRRGLLHNLCTGWKSSCTRSCGRAFEPLWANANVHRTVNIGGQDLYGAPAMIGGLIFSLDGQ